MIQHWDWLPRGLVQPLSWKADPALGTCLVPALGPSQPIIHPNEPSQGSSQDLLAMGEAALTPQQSTLTDRPRGSSALQITNSLYP